MDARGVRKNDHDESTASDGVRSASRAPGRQAYPQVVRRAPDPGLDLDLCSLTETVCPACGARLHHEKCKVVCRSAVCVHRIVYNCAEF